MISKIQEEIINLCVNFEIGSLTLSNRIKIGITVAIIKSLNLIQANFSSLLNNVYMLYNDALYANQYFVLLDLEVESKEKNYYH